MKTKQILSVLLALMIALPGFAEELIPATSEDIADFDKRVSDQLDSDIDIKDLDNKRNPKADVGNGKDKSKDKSKDKNRKQNFGLIVSTEAHRLNESGDKKKQFGKWVSEQRRQNSTASSNGSDGNKGSGGSASNTGMGSAMSADAKNAAPGLDGTNGHGNGTTKNGGKSNNGKNK